MSASNVNSYFMRVEVPWIASFVNCYFWRWGLRKMDMPTPEEEKHLADVRRLANRSVAEGRKPIEIFSLSDLPPEIIRAFPSAKDWLVENNRRFAEYGKRLNVVLPV